jgi:hypothetical protein
VRVFLAVSKPLAEIVIDENLCTLVELARAARIADERRVPLVAVLVRESGLDEVALLAALRRHIRVGVADPGTTAADLDAVRLLSRDVCNRLRVLPLSLADYDSGSRLIRLAMADPTDTVALAEVEHLTGCVVEPELMTLSAIEELVEKVYRAFVTEVMPHRPADDQGRPQKTTTPFPIRGQPPDLGSGTVPFRRVSDDADLPTRHEALLRLLFRHGVVTEDEFEEEVRHLIKEREPEHS